MAGNQSTLVAALLLCAACGGEPSTLRAAPAPPEAPPPAAPPSAPSFTFPLVAGATDGSLTVGSAGASLHGSGGPRVGSISIDQGTGEVELDGAAVPAVSYLVQAFDGYTLYQTIAVEKQRIWMLWFYCSGDSLTDVYVENTNGGLGAFEGGVSGTCQDSGVRAPVTVRFPALALERTSLAAGYDIEGPGIWLDGAAPGAIVVNGRTLDLLVFAAIDCTVTCGPPGWSELHSLLWDPEAASVSFGILYLLENQPRNVSISYSLTLPALSKVDLGMTASWTRPIQRHGLPGAGHRQVTVPPAR